MSPTEASCSRGSARVWQQPWAQHPAKILNKQFNTAKPTKIQKYTSPSEQMCFKSSSNIAPMAVTRPTAAQVATKRQSATTTARSTNKKSKRQRPPASMVSTTTSLSEGPGFGGGAGGPGGACGPGVGESGAVAGVGAGGSGTGRSS
eukprot:CAMPEP_0170372672 /NCGR_PEP_ID=MMETSP0117_2-20130122/9673_1 /TAXON_ID=400756 /ORGANISM="Durinskia baltica, Strain CSIRO CS-38" /LENGTH=146 /DNA_ID=CAMNT_0010627537 /DNA_START=99 /DNA_END=536 /DNA_ORIENTATION=+